MKLQFIFLASTLALTFSKNIPKNIPLPELNEKTQNNIAKLGSNAVKTAQDLLKKNGVKVNIQAKLQQALKAGDMQLKKGQNEANNQYNKVAGMSLGELIDLSGNELDAAIDDLEDKAPDGVKSLIDIAQGALKGLAKAGKEALNNKQDWTVDDLAQLGSDSLEQSVNQGNKYIKNANKKLNQIKKKN